MEEKRISLQRSIHFLGTRVTGEMKLSLAGVEEEEEAGEQMDRFVLFDLIGPLWPLTQEVPWDSFPETAAYIQQLHDCANTNGAAAPPTDDDQHCSSGQKSGR